MDPGLLTALSGLMGTIVGATVTVANQRMQHRRELAREDIQKHEVLYSEFVSECARLMVDALQHELAKPETLLPAYALVNRIRICASNEVLAAAERLLDRITDQYFSPNLSVAEVRDLARSADADPLRVFGEACRREMGEGTHGLALRARGRLRVPAMADWRHCWSRCRRSWTRQSSS